MPSAHPIDAYLADRVARGHTEAARRRRLHDASRRRRLRGALRRLAGRVGRRRVHRDVRPYPWGRPA